MSNAIAKVETKNYLALQKGGGVAEALAANLGEGAALSEGDLTRVSIPTGGGTQWTIPSVLGDESTPEIEGILVAVVTRGLLWGSDEPMEGELPILVSHDLQTARVVNEDGGERLAAQESARNEDGTYRWADLPANQWGSGRKGRGKQCREQRVLFILREQDTLPLVVNVSPGSLKNWKQFIVGLVKAGVPHYRAVVNLGLEKAKTEDGTAYSMIKPELAGVLDEKEGKRVQEAMTRPMQAVAASSFAG